MGVSAAPVVTEIGGEGVRERQRRCSWTVSLPVVKHSLELADARHCGSCWESNIDWIPHSPLTALWSPNRGAGASLSPSLSNFASPFGSSHSRHLTTWFLCSFTTPSDFAESDSDTPLPPGRSGRWAADKREPDDGLNQDGEGARLRLKRGGCLPPFISWINTIPFAGTGSILPIHQFEGESNL